ncbi:protein myomaker isoform X2 [Pantherophis guttatus]|uniref:Protein myomaker isoform X2 n=1 Tax=Pantherophis guttatus TaxID=94885 RepID=A0A6P9CTW3_PANGU|nr:protein myomaker isoform X2 [Pantherophis guttatus]
MGNSLFQRVQQSMTKGDLLFLPRPICPSQELLQRQLAPEGSLLLGDGRGHLFKWNPRTGAAGGLPAAVVHRRREEMGRCVRPLSSVPAAFFPQHSQGLALAPQSPGQPSGVGAALLPMGSLAAKFLLPTVSSLAFLPTVSIAAKRQFHMEAMVYFFTMFFVSVCHACEGPGLTFLCFMKYDLLQYFSIFGTALSMWVSLIALAEFDEPKRSTLVMFGALTIAVRIYHDRWGYGVYSGPIGTAVLVITVKWCPTVASCVDWAPFAAFAGVC